MIDLTSNEEVLKTNQAIFDNICQTIWCNKEQIKQVADLFCSFKVIATLELVEDNYIRISFGDSFYLDVNNPDYYSVKFELLNNHKDQGIYIGNEFEVLFRYLQLELKELTSD